MRNKGSCLLASLSHKYIGSNIHFKKCLQLSRHMACYKNVDKRSHLYYFSGWEIGVPGDRRTAYKLLGQVGSCSVHPSSVHSG